MGIDPEGQFWGSPREVMIPQLEGHHQDSPCDQGTRPQAKVPGKLERPRE